MTSRHSIESLEDLARYLSEGISNRRATLQRGAHGFDPDDLARLEGEVNAFRKVLTILDSQFEIRP